MPCNSDYMEPTALEAFAVETAKLLIFAQSKLGVATDEREERISKTLYPSKDDADYVTAALCSLLGLLDEDMLNYIVYNAKDKASRKLADWWEEHQKADENRITEEWDAEVHELVHSLNDVINSESTLLKLLDEAKKYMKPEQANEIRGLINTSETKRFLKAVQVLFAIEEK